MLFMGNCWILVKINYHGCNSEVLSLSVCGAQGESSRTSLSGYSFENMTHGPWWATCVWSGTVPARQCSFVELEVVGATKCSIFCPCPCPHAFSVGVNNYWPVWPTPFLIPVLLLYIIELVLVLNIAELLMAGQMAQQ
jgi:hypothetical protein